MAGSIEKRGKDSYRLIVCHGFNLECKPIRHTKTVHGTKAQAKVELAKFVAEVEQGTVIEGKSITFKEFTEIWKRDYGSKELAPSTYNRYLGMLEARILPYLGHFKLDRIKPTDIMKFYDMLDKDTQIRRVKCNNGYRTLKPLSQKTILEHHRLIRAMLHKAVYWQLLFNNPCERVQPPKSKKPKRRYYDDEQCKVLLSHLNELTTEDIKYKVAILLDIFSGIRRGELIGLEWSDVDFKNETININKSTQYLPENGIFDKDTKTESSNRIVPIPDYITKTLLEYREWYDEQKDIWGDKWIESNKLFVQDNGKPMHPDTIGKWFKPYIEELGLPIIKFHGIRHTNATLMIANNVDIATVSARLGHASINTTIKYYVHPLEKNMRKAAYVLQDLLIGDK